MPPKHILFLTSWYPTRLVPDLGTFVQSHANAAAGKNIVSVVFAVSDPGLAEGQQEIVQKQKGNLFEVIIFYGKIRSGIFGSWKKLRTYQKAMAEGIRIAADKNGKPALLHLHVIWPAAVATLLFLRKNKVPLVITEHWSGYLPEDGNYKGYFLKRTTRAIVRQASIITVVSGQMMSAMKRHGLGKNFIALPNAVDINLFAPLPVKRHNTSIRLLHVSVLIDREKNITGLLHVMKELSRQEDITLDIIGDSPERPAHESFAKSLDILNKTVFFRGFQKPAEIPLAMQQADALVMFSNYEGMPMTIIEAQSCGLPVIATKVGAIAEMVNKSQGILVSPGKESELKEAILAFAEKRAFFSPGKIRDHAVQTYSFDAVSEKLENIYSSVLHAH